MVSQAFSKLPTVKFGPENSTPGSGSWAPTCESVRHALEEYGCFVAEYDGICSELDRAVFRALEELFDLPIERKALNTSGKPYFGYVGQIPEIPLYESMGMDEANTLEGSQSFTSLMWPNGNQHFWYEFISFVLESDFYALIFLFAPFLCLNLLDYPFLLNVRRIF